MKNCKKRIIYYLEYIVDPEQILEDNDVLEVFQNCGDIKIVDIDVCEVP